MRNEILEAGQKILLYASGEWNGRTIGLGTLVECEHAHSRNGRWDVWNIALENGERVSWTMLRTDKELLSLMLTCPDDEIPF